MPGQAGETRCPEAAGAAATRPQSAVKPGHLGAPHQGGAEEAGGGTAGGGERSSLMEEKGSLHKRSVNPNWDCPVQDPAFCAKVHGKLNKVSTASAAAAESLDDNRLQLMLVNGRIIR